jgi:hypothetical protein
MHAALTSEMTLTPPASSDPTLVVLPDDADTEHARGDEDDAELTDDEVAAALFVLVARELEAGRSPKEIEADLVRAGADPGLAAALTGAANDEGPYSDVSNLSGGGGSTMMFGALWMVGGLVATALSYGAGGDSYVVFWGAVVYGGIQILRGMADL